jgi:hypothetical protein
MSDFFYKSRSSSLHSLLMSLWFFPSRSRSWNTRFSYFHVKIFFFFYLNFMKKGTRIFTFAPCILILSKLFIHQLLHKWVVLEELLKFTLKQLGHVSVQSHHRQGAHYSVHICIHIITVLTTHRSILMDYFNKCNFSKHE